jgi:GMP synthase (glutamine-hydrolysing)
VPILGVCLGAQLIASTGTPIYRGPVKEIGWSSVSITPQGQVDSLLGYLPKNATVFQWHSDGFDLPAGAIRLASSINFENQAFRVGKTIYGLQFHLGVTPRMIERWIDERSKDLAQAPYVMPDKIRADTQSYAPTLKYYGERFLTEFVRRAVRSKAARIPGVMLTDGMVLIIDDHEPSRQNLVNTLTQTGYKIAGETVSGSTAATAGT